MPSQRGEHLVMRGPPRSTTLPLYCHYLRVRFVDIKVLLCILYQVLRSTRLLRTRRLLPCVLYCATSVLCISILCPQLMRCWHRKVNSIAVDTKSAPRGVVIAKIPLSEPSLTTNPEGVFACHV